MACNAALVLPAASEWRNMQRLQLLHTDVKAAMRQVPYVAADSEWLGCVVDTIAKHPRQLRELFGKKAPTELEGPNAYHHGGTEYLLDDRPLLSLGGLAPNPRGDIGRWHDLQLVLRQIDEGSAKPTRGMQASCIA